MIVSGELEQRHVRRRARLARHQVPVEVHQGRAVQLTMADVGSACLAVALLTAALRRRRRRSTARARAGASGSPPARRAIYCLAGLCVTAFAILEVGLPALGLLVRARGRGLLDRHADLLQGHRAVGDPGRLAAAVGHAAVAVRERGAVPHAPLAARHRAVRHRGARRDRRLLPAADGRLGEPVRHARERRRPRARASTRCCATRR